MSLEAPEENLQENHFPSFAWEYISLASHLNTKFSARPRTRLILKAHIRLSNISFEFIGFDLSLR